MSPQFGAAFNYVLQRPGGFTNMLLLTVCELIPAIGPIVSLGYRSEVAEALDRDPDLRRYPKFTFDRFIEYLMRGVWPFLVTLVVAFVFYLPMVGLVLGIGFGLGAAGVDPAIIVPLGVTAFIAVVLVFSALAMPMMLHAQLTAKFDLPGAFRFALDFWKLVPGPAILTGVVFVPLSTLIVLLGMLACFVGIYPANTLSQMAAQHLMMQLYREYVDRGGEPVINDGPVPPDELEPPDEPDGPAR
jgi:hypothetical protein